MKTQTDIFLSHNVADKDWTEKLAYKIEPDQSGYSLTLLFDKWDISHGASIPRELERRLTDSKFIGLIMSSDAFKSEWVGMEYTVGIIVDPAAIRS